MFCLLELLYYDFQDIADYFYLTKCFIAII